ncbi:hypothetical protein NYE69_06700 [Paenibacillus sp. FSL R5-0527]|uniref:hypothetical protein n=1 Tax=Paenibacillus sp. FSL R5-0527 TaxID=2975321 RepID=UPI00097B16A5|nr:hypothetical protein BK140_09120 [Paenibacillus macerans]
MAFIFVVSVIAFVMFLIWGIAAKIQKKKARWKFLVSLLSLVVVFIAFPSPDDKATRSDSDSHAQNNQTTISSLEPDETSNQQQPNNDSFSEMLTFDEFKENYQNAVTKYSLDRFSIKDMEAKEETAGGGTFNYLLNNNIALSGTYNESKNIEIISLLVEGDGTEETGQDIMVSMGLFLMGTNPTLETTDTEDILREIGLDGSDPNKIIDGTSTVKSGIRYTMKLVNDTKVVMLTATNANDS